MNNNSKSVFITGGSRGIGRAMVLAFKKAGYRVAAVSSSEKSMKLIPTGAEGAELSFVCDVRQPQAVQAAAKRVQEAFGGLTVLINNAGAAGTNALELSASSETSDQLWERIIDVNLNGTYRVTRHFLPLLKDGQGRVINLGSVLSHRGVPDATAYCAAKHGVLGFTRALAHALAPRKITANVICPGWTRTDMAIDRLSEIGITEEQMQKSVPLQRFVEPQEVAELAVYLASEKAAAVTGQSFTIDGGVLA